MSFEVTATRRRPKTFGELAGQEFVSATLSASIQSGKTAHAYLFSGPRGCGKTSAARILARALNCEKGPAKEPCGVCPSCLEISKGSNLDVIEIDGASNTGVQDIRQIKDEVLFPPHASRFKIYIIDEVHMLSTSAFNALLKTIEEPPPYIVFIFATTELHKVPATIKSRCQQFAFKLIPIETIQALLRRVCDELAIQAEDEALFWIARESTGSLRDAYTLFDQVVSFSNGNIRTELIHEKLGLAGLEQLNSFAEACAAGETGTALTLLDKIIESGVSIEQFTTDLASYYRNLLLIKCGITRESLLGYHIERFSAKVLEQTDQARLEEAVRLALELFRSIRYSVSPRFELETLTARLAALPCWVPPAELYRALQDVRKLLGGERAPEDGAVSAKMPPPWQDNASSGTAVRQSAPPAENRPVSEAAPAPKFSIMAEFEQKLAGTLESQKTQSGTPHEAEEPPAEKIPADVEVVRRVFNGEIVRM